MSNTELPQRIYRRNEIPIADHLMSFQTALRDDFMRGFNTLAEAAGHVLPSLDGRDDMDSFIKDYLVTDTDVTVPDIYRWRTKTLKYEFDEADMHWKDHDAYKQFPTAMHLIDYYGDDCPIANYSLLAPHSVINRHTGVENREGNMIRIHIPLIVPEGEVFFEVNDEVVHWDDIFAFNNQYVHSAHNRTNEWRLCFLIDISRERAGLPPGAHYDTVKHLDVFNTYFSG